MTARGGLSLWLYSRYASYAPEATRYISDLMYGQVRRTHLSVDGGDRSVDAPLGASKCVEHHVGLGQNFLEPLHH